MQDIHAIGGGAGGNGRFFGGGDRRLRPHNHSNLQALECPRCDSLNTKFCYYNNYNLSQPRHFCKSCRRYWTKGGVLRNVPVGGGCRKTKRSKHKSTAGPPPSADASRERSSNAQSSSSESSSLTAATPTSAFAEEGSALCKTTSVYPFSDARFFNGNSNLDHQPVANQSSSGNQISAPEIGALASTMASSGDMNMIGFGMADIRTTSYGQSEQGNQGTEFKMQEMSSEGLDWGSGGGGGSEVGDQGMYDLTAAVDPAYWSQPQWNDNDQSLNFLH